MNQSAGTGRRLSRIDLSGHVKFSFLNSSSKQLRPQTVHRVTSATTVARLKLGKYSRSDSRTLVTTVRRRVPATALSVRPVSRAIAGLRNPCSAVLFVPGTGFVSPKGVSTAAAVTKVNNCSSRRRRISSLHSKR